MRDKGPKRKKKRYRTKILQINKIKDPGVISQFSLLVCVCLKLYLLIPGNKMIGIYMPMFVTSLLNFIPGYKMFLGIENFSQGRG